jgi:hypothetical protein
MNSTVGATSKYWTMQHKRLHQHTNSNDTGSEGLWATGRLGNISSCPIIYLFVMTTLQTSHSTTFQILYNWSDGLLLCTPFKTFHATHVLFSLFFTSFPYNQLSPFLFRHSTATSISCYQESPVCCFGHFVRLTIPSSGTVTHYNVASYSHVKELVIRRMTFTCCYSSWEPNRRLNNTDKRLHITETLQMSEPRKTSSNAVSDVSHVDEITEWI